MSQFILTIQDIEQQTGLTRKYIDRCYARFGSLLMHFRKPSPDGNKYLYSDNALVVFQQVRNFRDQGMKLPEIRDNLTRELGSRVEDMGSSGEVVEKKVGNPPADSSSVDMTAFISALERSYEKALESEHGKVLLLEESVEIRKKREEEHIKKIAYFKVATNSRADLLSQLEKVTGFGRKKKREGILEQLRRIDLDALNAPVSDATIDVGKSTDE
ncbi:MAG: hypothetical protein BMS9Abin05_2150 [Rhodothermia bacterium]|nr:MAG: hypothetical protein BMS9Abin05_2150 [Rhodothermia bacterium]